MSGFKNYDVMISYSTKKKKIAEDITAMLNDNGYNVWIAPISIPNGGDYVDEIYAAIENSRIVLFVLSEESLNSKWCQNELVYAVKLNKKVLPVQVAEVIDPYNKLGKINYVLQRKQILDLFPLYKERLNEIVDDIEKLLNDKGLKHNPYPQNSYEFDDDTSLLVGRDTEVNEINDAL